MLYKEKDEYKLIDTPVKGSPYSCPLRGRPGAIATIHMHPQGSGPSLQDLIHLLYLLKLSDGEIKDSFIAANTGKKYNLHITDTAKANQFYQSFNTTTGKNSLKDLLQQYAEVQEQQRKEVDGEFHEHEYHLFAMALLLREKDSGVVLTEMNMESFEQLDAWIIEKEGQRIKKIMKTRCKY